VEARKHQLQEAVVPGHAAARQQLGGKGITAQGGRGVSYLHLWEYDFVYALVGLRGTGLRAYACGVEGHRTSCIRLWG